MDKLQHIEYLVERFLDGRTTIAEEKELYEWFATADVPEKWKELKAMFAWYADGMPEQGVSVRKSGDDVPLLRRSVRLYRWIVGAAVAACATLLWVLWPAMESVEEPMHIYEGSYIVEYGVVCSDMAYIESDIEEMMKRAEEMERKADRLLAWVDM